MEPEEILNLYKYSLESGEKRTKFDGLQMHGKHFTSCDLRCVDWGRSDLSHSLFNDCDLRGSDFADVKMTRAKLVRCRVFDCKFPPDPTIEFIDCQHQLFGD